MGEFAKKAIQALQRREAKNEGEILLDTPIRGLKRPLTLHSQFLDEVIYLVTNEEMARRVEDQERVAYTTEEIRVLSRASKERDREEWIDFLKRMQLVKKTFLGSRIQA